MKRQRRHNRIRAKLSGTAERPRVCVFKSNRHLFVQAVDDVAGKTLASNKPTKPIKGTKTDAAKAIGLALAKAMQGQGITKAVFDIGGYKYHGRVKAIAEGLREGGIAV